MFEFIKTRLSAWGRKLDRLSHHIDAWFGLIWFYVHSGKYRRQVLIYLGVGLLCGAFYIVGYFTADHRYQKFETALNRLGQELGLEWEKEPLFVRFAMVKREIDVAAKMVDQLKQFLYEKTRDVEVLKEQVYFYKSVIAPEDIQEGVSIFSVGISEPEEGKYPIEIVLRKMDKKSSFVKGHIEIAAYGLKDDEYVSLAGLDKDSIHFSFRYFQRIKGAISLPQGFTPEQLKITVISKDFERVEQKFLWRDIV